MKQVTAISNRGYKMEFDGKVWVERNWLYLNGADRGTKGSKVVIDIATGEIVKGQSHQVPVFASGEIDRIIDLFR